MTAETTSTPETSQTTRTLYGHLNDWAQQTPDRVLVTQLDPAQGDAATDDVTRQLTPVTAAGLLERATALAAWLRERGVGEGDCIAVWLPAWVDSYAWQFAASAVGAHVIGVNTRYNVAEVSHVLVKARPAVLVAAHGFQRVDFLATLHRVAEGLPAETPRPFVLVTSAPGAAGDGPDLAAWDLGSGSADASAIGTPVPEAAAGLRLEPSACAGLRAAGHVMAAGAGGAAGTHVAWLTGGSLMPDEEYAQLRDAGWRLSRRADPR